MATSDILKLNNNKKTSVTKWKTKYIQKMKKWIEQHFWE